MLVKVFYMLGDSIQLLDMEIGYIWSESIQLILQYPHTAVGRWITLLFGWICAPLFMAFKIEMGEIISLTILYLGRGIFRGVQKLVRLV